MFHTKKIKPLKIYCEITERIYQIYQIIEISFHYDGYTFHHKRLNIKIFLFHHQKLCVKLFFTALIFSTFRMKIKRVIKERKIAE